MKVLVTGCAGFIGWKVSERLLEEGHRVLGVDDLNDSYDPRLKCWRLSQLQPNPHFEFHHGDICDREQMERLFQQGHFDAVVNLAARVGVRQSIEDPWVYFKTNVIGLLVLLELCRTYRVRRFILASTSSLYGFNERPFREDQSTDRPLSPYASSKKAAEALCYTYHHLYGLDITVLRYFTVYGPAGRPDMSVFRFIKWIAEGEPVTVYGDGTQERDFTYVDDIADGTFAALSFLSSRTSAAFEIINLGSDRPVPLNRVISILEDLLGKKAKVLYKSAHPADVPATWADISKARELLNWEPKTGLEEGLKRTVDWYTANRHWAKEVDTLR